MPKAKYTVGDPVKTVDEFIQKGEEGRLFFNLHPFSNTHGRALTYAWIQNWSLHYLCHELKAGLICEAISMPKTDRKRGRPRKVDRKDIKTAKENT